MRFPALLLAILALLLVSASVHAQTGTSSGVFRRTANPLNVTAVRSPGAAAVTVDREALRRFRIQAAGRLELPLADGSTLTLALQRFEVLAPGATVTLSGARGPVTWQPDLTLFKGPVEGEPGSLAVIAMTSGQVRGWVEHAAGRLIVAPLDGTSDTHAITDEADLPAPPADAFVCPSDELPRNGFGPPAGLPALPLDVQATTTRLVCDLALDCDYEFFVKEGSDATHAVNYALVLLGTTSAIYEREINVSLRASYLNVWTTAADPYSATTISPALTEFQAYWNSNRSGVTRDLTQLVSGRALGGGIAWLDVLCNTSYGYSVIANLNGNNPYPSAITTWDVNVMAHELGHNFSSSHTHSCWWQSNGYAPAGALLDSCYTAEGSCFTGSSGGVPADLGTIMSYCHLTGGQGSIRLDFHPACRSVMRYAAENAYCFAAATVQPPSALTIATSPAGASLSWTASPTAGVLRYDVYRSPWPQDLAPTLIGTTSGTGFTDLAIGTFWFKVRAARGADSSAFCGEAKSAVCGLAAPVAYTVGSSPTACLSADFDNDGILDLATADFRGNTVSILRGLGTDSTGNGTFATAVPYDLPSGSYPASLASGDFNGDGLLDLVVADQLAAGASLLFGQGIGGIGDGTFTAGPTLAVSSNPWAITVGDFNADGISDLAVACGSGNVSVLIGHGTDGVADGTFAPAVDYVIGSTLYAITTGDFDSNGITDLAAAGNGGVSVLPGLGTDGRGDGTFGTQTNYACQSSPYGVTTGDFNADGITDLAVANAGSSSVSILLGSGADGQGDGGFLPPAHYACGASPNAVVVGDWNGDGVPDLAVPNGSTTNTLSILTGGTSGGQPDGTFAPRQAFATGTRARMLASGDFDHDGMADFAVANGTAPGRVSIVLASCQSPLPATLQVTTPAGDEQWITGTRQTLAWTRGAGILAVDIALSRDGGASWQTLARNVTDTTWTWNVTGAYTTQARIRVADPAVPGRATVSDSNFTIFPAALLDADGALPASLALRGVWPNPARGAVHVWLTLASNEPARLELFDLAGRRVRTVELGGRGAGLHRVDLVETRSLRPGLYLIHLSQAGRRATGKLIVIR
jgi:hypothetical protein